MKLISVYIDNFGKLSNFKYNFNDELTTIIEDNGWGKTTLVSFIVSMFFGLPSMKGRAILDNDRIHYAPWNGGKFGGSLIFVLDNKKYEIRRTFDPLSSGKDIFSLIDLRTNKEINALGNLIIEKGNVGQILFGVDKSSFERTTLIPQGDITFSNEKTSLGKIEDGINKRLQNIIQDTSEDHDYNATIKTLESVRDSILSKRGDRGRLANVNTSIRELAQKIDTCHEAKDMIDSQTEILKQNESKLLKIDERIKEINNLIDQNKSLETLNEQKERYHQSKEEIMNLENDLNEIKSFFGGLDPHKIELRKIKNEIENLDDEKEKLQKIENEISIEKGLAESQETKNLTENHLRSIYLEKSKALQKEKDELTLRIQKLNSKTQPSKLKLIILSILTFSIYYFVWRKNQKEAINNLELYKTRLDEVEVELLENKNNLEKLENKSQAPNSNLDSLFEKQKVIEDKIRKITNNLDEMFIEINSSKTSYIERYFEVESFLNSYFDNERILKEKRRNFELFLKGKDLNKLQNELQINDSFDELIHENDVLKEQRDQIIKEITRSKKDIELKESIFEDLTNLETAKLDLEEQREDLNLKFETLLKTIKFLINAKEQLAVQYLEPLSKRCEKLYNSFDLETSLVFNGDSKILIKEKNGSLHNLEYFSHGTRELISICMRFSLIDILYENSTSAPFIVLDDPFVNIDDNRFPNLKDILLKLSKKYQIIYLTCSSSRNIE